MDEYGGEPEGRVRIFEEIYRRSTELAGKDFPILVKMNGSDFLPGGVTLEEARIHAALLEQIGFSAIEVSGGMWECITRSEKELGWKARFIPEARTGIQQKEEEGYFWPFAKEIKKEVNIPLILVGGLKSLSRIHEILEGGDVDFCAMSRPFIRQPDLPLRWLGENEQDTAECLSCNACLKSLRHGGLRCEAKKQDEDNCPQRVISGMGHG